MPAMYCRKLNLKVIFSLTMKNTEVRTTKVQQAKPRLSQTRDTNGRNQTPFTFCSTPQYGSKCEVKCESNIGTLLNKPSRNKIYSLNNREIQALKMLSAAKT